MPLSAPTPARRRAAAAVVALLLLLVPAAASAAAGVSTSGSFGITPARRHVTGLPGSFLTPTEVINTTSSSYQVNVFPVLLTQDLTGAFNFSETDGALAAGGRVLSATPSAFTLLPGHEARVQLHWTGMPSSARQAVVGVVFQGVRQHQNGQVLVVTRLLSVNFLTLPGHLTVSGRFTGLRAIQFGRGVLRFLPRIENTGQRAWAPSDGGFEITNSAGRVVYRTPWVGDVVIPGAQREFPIDVHKVLPAGTYSMTATADFGRHESISSHFTLAGPNQLPSAGVTATSVSGNGTVGSPAHVAIRVMNGGTATGSIAIHVKLIGAGAQALSRHFHASTAIVLAHLAPGFDRTINRRFGARLLPGSYQLQANWLDSTGVPHTVVVAFTATAPGHGSGRAGWLSRHWALIVGLLAGALALLALVLLLRRQRRLEAALAAAQASQHANDDGAEARELVHAGSRWE